MKNFSELFKVLAGHTDEETLAYLLYDHVEDVVQEAMKIKHNNTTRKTALESYKKGTGSIKQDEENGIYCDGHTALSIPVKRPHYNEELPAFKFLMGCVKSNRRPYCLRESIDYAIAYSKIDGWKMGDTTHYIKIGEAKYNLSLVAKVFNVIADPKHINGCEIESVEKDNPESNILMLRSKYGVGIILPFIGSAIGIYDATPGDTTLDKLVKKHNEKEEKIA